MSKQKPYYYALPLFLLLSVTYLCTLPDQLHGWNSGWYAMDYSLGFDSRLFIGSLLRLFYPDFLPASAVYAFTVLSTFALLALLSWTLACALCRTASLPGHMGLMALVALYLLSPGSPAYLWSTENMGRFDLYLLLFTLAAGMVCFHVGSFPICFAVFTLCGLIALSIHQVYLFTFFPLLFTLYLLAAPLPEKGKIRRLLAALLCFSVLGAAFLYFQFFSQIRVGACEELTAILAARTDMEVNASALRYEYFTDIAQAFRELAMNGLGERLRYGAITVFLLSPLAVLYGWFWKTLLKTAKSLSSGQKHSGTCGLPAGSLPFFYYLLMPLSQLLFLPAFVLTIDWGRWFGAFLTVQTLQVVFLAAKKDAPALAALETLSAVVRRHPFLFVCIALWMGGMQKFQATLLPDAPIFFTSVYRLFHILF